MTKQRFVKSADLPLIGVPAFWPMATATAMIEQGLDLYVRNLEFVTEEIKLHSSGRPSPPRTACASSCAPCSFGNTASLAEFPPVDAPYAGHTAMIADFQPGQSLIETLLANGLHHVLLTDWKSATVDMKDLEIDNYLAELVVAIDDLGGRVDLIGLCQGGWMAAMAAARFLTR